MSETTPLQEHLPPTAMVVLVRGAIGVPTADYCVTPAALLTSYIISTVFQLKKFVMQRAEVSLGATPTKASQIISGAISLRMSKLVGQEVAFTDTEEVVKLVSMCSWGKSQEFAGMMFAIHVNGVPFELPSDKAKAKRTAETWAGAKARQLKILADGVAGAPAGTLPTHTAVAPSPALQPPRPAAPTNESMLAAASAVTQRQSRQAENTPTLDAMEKEPVQDVVAATADETYLCPSCANPISIHTKAIHTLRCRGPTKPLVVPASAQVPAEVVRPHAPPTLPPKQSTPPPKQSTPPPKQSTPPPKHLTPPSSRSASFDSSHVDDAYDSHFQDIPTDEIRQTVEPMVAASSRFPPLYNHPPSHSSSASPLGSNRPQPQSLYDDAGVDYCKDDAAMAARLQKEADRELEAQSRRLAESLAEPSHTRHRQASQGPSGIFSRLNPFSDSRTSSSRAPQGPAHPLNPASRTAPRVAQQQFSGKSHHAFLDRASRSGPQLQRPSAESASASQSKPARRAGPSSLQPRGSPQLTQDELLAKQLQMEEDEEIARTLSSSEASSSRLPPIPRSGDTELARRLAAEDRKRQEEADEAYARQLMQEEFQ